MLGKRAILVGQWSRCFERSWRQSSTRDINRIVLIHGGQAIALWCLADKPKQGIDPDVVSVLGDKAQPETSTGLFQFMVDKPLAFRHRRVISLLCSPLPGPKGGDPRFLARDLPQHAGIGAVIVRKNVTFGSQTPLHHGSIDSCSLWAPGRSMLHTLEQKYWLLQHCKPFTPHPSQAAQSGGTSS